MKKLCILTLAALFCLPLFSALAEITTEGVYTFEIPDDGEPGTATLLRYSGTQTAELSLPLWCRDYPVTAIGEGAFQNHSELTGVGIPARIASIGASAFEGCENLTSVEIPANVTALSARAFAGCTSLMTILGPAGGSTQVWAVGQHFLFIAE